MLKIIKNLTVFFFLVASIFAVVNFSLAANVDVGLEYGDNIGLSNEDPRIIAANIVRVVLGFLGIIAVVLIIYGGWVWMTSNGNEENVTKAKKILINAVIGLVIIFSAFAIVSFIINKLSIASGIKCEPGSTRTCGSCLYGVLNYGYQTCSTSGYWGSCVGLQCNGPGPNPNGFYIKSTVPKDEASNVIRNVKVRFNFNKAINEETVDENSFTVKKSDGSDIPGVRTISGGRIEFTPDSDCPDNPCGALKCFEENINVEIEATNDIKSIIIGTSELSCVPGWPCKINFTIGELIDCEDPKVNLYFNSGQVCVDTENEIFASAKDDSGISNIEFYSDNDDLPFEDKNNEIGENPFNTFAIWNGDGYEVGEEKTFKVIAYDLDDHSSNDSKKLTLRESHCCDGTQNEDEEGTDCGGEDCAGCEGSACGISLFDNCKTNPYNCDNNRCASSFCNCGEFGNEFCKEKGYNIIGDYCCICEQKPIIDWITPEGGFCDGNINVICESDDVCSSFSPSTCNIKTANGAVGNLATIGGRHFGDYNPIKSKVEFSADNGVTWIEAFLPDIEGCDNNWKKDQIIVVVPSGLDNDPGIIIKVTARSEYYDQTNDASGKLINFIINNIERPGLCKLDPEDGIMNDVISYYGLKLNNTKAYFGDGNASSSLEALNSLLSDENNNTASVPNIKTGKISSFVKNASNIKSNYLKFIKKGEPYSGPYITSFDPIKGAPGQYITIYGGGFGNQKGSNSVFFGSDTDGIEASFDFPDVCLDSLWSDNQVLIKVPEEIDNGDYILTMKIGTWMIDTSGDKFNVNDALPLTPSLCKIEPIIGQNNDPISLWGEYFGEESSGLVRFHNNKDQNTFNFWGTEDDTNKVKTTVHTEAISGPIRIVQNSIEGNGMNFKIGICEKDEDCGSQFCCPNGSVEEGRCKNDLSECYSSIKSSVYEWDFSTGATEPPTPGDSCQGWAMQTGYCHEKEFCPNSPGQCSVYDGSGQKIDTEVSCADSVCDGFGSCDDTCVYNDTLNKCVNSSSCSLNKIVKDVDNSISDPKSPYYDLNAYCSDYEGGKWHINTVLSCPNSDWKMLFGGKCVYVKVGATCDLCLDGFSCFNNSGSGVCGIDKNICPIGSTCDTSDNKCKKDDSSSCDCCCEIDQDARDCCAPLTCEGTCGSDTTIETPNEGFGRCSGCKIFEADGVTINQADSDLACNCLTSSGKFCDTSTPAGVCRDCGQLRDNPEECSVHNSVCCFDGNKEKNLCVGLKTDQGLINDPYGSDIKYCAYYKCEEAPEYGCYGEAPDYTKIASSTSAVFTATSTCELKCPSGPVESPGGSCFDESQNTCSKTCLFPGAYLCLGDTGCEDNLGVENGGCTAGDGSCICCCNPSDDQCSSVFTGDSTVLNCQANKTPCTATDDDERGLCCGCEKDSHCGAVNVNGCSSDTCCRARPNVIDEGGNGENDPVPYNKTDNVCRNAQISAVFDQQMNVSSFTGNVIVVGDYGSDECPEGTYLAFGEGKNNFFFKIKKFLSKVPVVKKFFAEYAMAIEGNFCAVKGIASGEHIDQAEKTKLIFSVSSLMDSEREYYVIIKGEKNLEDENHEGVLSYWDVGINATKSAVDNTFIFNGLTFPNSYIWKFTTMNEEDDADKCQINEIEIDPSSYLFQTIKNDSSEKDTDFNSKSFDTVADRDKVFTGNALASEEAGRQVIVPVKERNWSWDWVINNPNILENISVTDLPDNKILIGAQPEIVDAKTFINANVDSGGKTITATSTVYVFICENPWPMIDGNSWSPWQDNSSNCTVNPNEPGAIVCHDTNYELYYCRDSGGFGTSDDLPILKDNSTVVGMETGTEKLKEVYYFREDAPEATIILSESFSGEGKVGLEWTSVSGVTNYKVYYGTSSGNYNNTKIAATASITIDNLINGTKYYFAVTAATNGAESGYSNEISATPKDTTASLQPEILNIVPKEKKVDIGWKDSSDGDAVGFRIFYKATEICNGDVDFGSSLAVSYGKIGTTTVPSLANGVKYCFGMISYDKYGNKSATSTISAIPFSVAENLEIIKEKDREVELSWESEGLGVSGFKVYYGTSSGNYDNSEDVTDATATSTIVDGLTNGTTYYFVVKSINSDNKENDASKEEEAMPFSSPLNFQAEAGDENVKLKWDCDELGVDEYFVYYGIEPGSYNKRTNATATSTIINGLTNEITYYFIVKSANSNGMESDASSEVNAKPEEIVTP